MMDRSRYADLIATIAPTFSLDPLLVEAIVFVESADDPWAVRFEPVVYDSLRGNLANRFSPTEFVQRATSFGLLQILGQVARERGCTSPWLTELCDPSTGLTYGCKHLAWLLARARDLEETVRAYNAGLGGARQGRGQEYSRKVYTQWDVLKQS